MYDVTAILEIISSISSTLALDEILAEFTEKTAHIIGADGCAILSWDREEDTITVLANYVSPQFTEFHDAIRPIGLAYPLTSYPASSRALHEQLPLIIYVDDALADKVVLELLTALGWAGVLMIPMLHKGQAIGLLELFIRTKKRSYFPAEDISLCQALANQAAVAIENARLYQEAEEGQLHAEAMYVIGQALASELDYNRTIHNVADFAYRLVGADFVYLVIPEADGLRLAAAAGQNKQTLPDTRAGNPAALAHTRGLLKHIIQEKKPLLILNIQGHPAIPPAWREEAQGAGWRAFLAAPMLAHNRLLGVLAAYAHQPNTFNYPDIGILISLASQAAVAIQNARLFAEQETQREALHQLSLRLVNAQEEERRRISREIHDELGQALTAIKINLDIARRTMPAGVSPQLFNSINEAGLLAVQTLERARNLSMELHPALLDDLGLVSALRWEIDRYEQRTGQAVHFEVDLADISLRPELEITIYRIIIEALTNVARHAQAGHVSLDLRLAGGQLHLKIEDDGIGFDPTRLFTSQSERRSLGLVSMRERTELLGGHFEVLSQQGQGTKIRVRLPI